MAYVTSSWVGPVGWDGVLSCRVVREDAGVALTVGTDLVHVPRLARSLARPSFVDRVFTPAEQTYCHARPDRFAGRWAAKEAVMKALGHGIGEVGMTEIEIVSGRSGAPELRLHGSAAEVARQAGWNEWAISISHQGEYAVATAIGQS